MILVVTGPAKYLGLSGIRIFTIELVCHINILTYYLNTKSYDPPINLLMSVGVRNMDKMELHIYIELLQRWKQHFNCNAMRASF